jgi:hypothetical protein
VRDARCGAPVDKRPCADADGFSLHADVFVPDRDRAPLERLCRHVAALVPDSARPWYAAADARHPTRAFARTR